MMEHYDYAILGAGISGLAFARLLQLHRPEKTFIILEKESEPGGLCRTRMVNDMPFDISGGHFLYSRHPCVYQFIDQHVPLEGFNRFERKTKILIHDQYIDYPIENSLWQLPKGLQWKYVESLLYRHLKRPIKNGFNFSHEMINQLGHEICDNYLFPYNRKLWGVPEYNLSAEWLHKIPKTSLEKILKSIIFQENTPDNLPSHEYFYYPKKGGFSVIIEGIARFLNKNIILNTPVSEILKDIKTDHLIIDKKYSAKKVINTVPWPELYIMGRWGDYDKLQHSGIVVSLHKDSAAAMRYDLDHPQDKNWHWTYIPDEKTAHHREFYPFNYCGQANYNFVIRETNLSRWHDATRFLSEGYHINEYAYPIPVPGKDKAMKEMLEEFAEHNIYGLGRWGQWQHFNSDVCIFEAMQLMNKLENTNL